MVTLPRTKSVRPFREPPKLIFFEGSSKSNIGMRGEGVWGGVSSIQ